MRIHPTFQPVLPRLSGPASPAPAPAEVTVASVAAEPIDLPVDEPADPRRTATPPPTDAEAAEELASMLRVRAGSGAEVEDAGEGHDPALHREARELLRGMEDDARRELHEYARAHHGEDPHLMRDTKHALRDFRHVLHRVRQDLHHGEMAPEEVLATVTAAREELGAAFGPSEPVEPVTPAEGTADLPAEPTADGLDADV